MKIMFTGDLNFRGIENLDSDKSRKILTDVKPYTEKVDFVIPNLECPIGDKNKYIPIKKAGPNLICSEECVSFLKTLNTYAVTLANNHIGDYGSDALINTLDILKENNIKTVGAGKNIKEAYNALKIEKDNITVSVLSVCENEFGIATDIQAGSAGYAPKRLLNRIKEEKESGNFVVVVFHGGNEFNPLPSPDTVERYRFVCDMGADAVVGGHTHCPQGYEMYGRKPIIYSMGNFLFGNNSKTENTDAWYYGYFTILDINENGAFSESVPYKFNIECTKIKVFNGKEKEIMDAYISDLSKIIQKPDELKQYFKGWTLNHPWIPQAPADINDLSGYDSSGNYDLLKCEAHLSQAKQLLEILYNDEVGESAIWQEKISALQKMPL